MVRLEAVKGDPRRTHRGRHVRPRRESPLGERVGAGVGDVVEDAGPLVRHPDPVLVRERQQQPHVRRVPVLHDPVALKAEVAAGLLDAGQDVVERGADLVRRQSNPPRILTDAAAALFPSLAKGAAGVGPLAALRSPVRILSVPSGYASGATGSRTLPEAQRRLRGYPPSTHALPRRCGSSGFARRLPGQGPSGSDVIFVRVFQASPVPSFGGRVIGLIGAGCSRLR